MEHINDFNKKYNELKDDISVYLNHSIVDTTEKTISVFEFIRLANEYIRPLTEMQENNKYIATIMNDQLRKNIKGSNTPRETMNRLRPYVIDGFKIVPNYNKVYLEIYMHKSRGLLRPNYYRVCVGKKNNYINILSIEEYYEKYFTSNNLDIKECMLYLEDSILSKIDFAEQYMPFKDAVSQMNFIGNSLFDIKILYEKNGFQPIIKPNTRVIDQNVYFKKPDDNIAIVDFVNDNQDLLLWSIPINRSLLGNEVNDIITKQENSLCEILSRTKK